MAGCRLSPTRERALARIAIKERADQVSQIVVISVPEKPQNENIKRISRSLVVKFAVNSKTHTHSLFLARKLPRTIANATSESNTIGLNRIELPQHSSISVPSRT